MALVRLFFTYKKSKEKKQKQCGVTLWKQVTFFCTYVHFVLAQNISV